MVFNSKFVPVFMLGLPIFFNPSIIIILICNVFCSQHVLIITKINLYMLDFFKQALSLITLILKFIIQLRFLSHYRLYIAKVNFGSLDIRAYLIETIISIFL